MEKSLHFIQNRGKKMNKYFRIHDHELLSDTHFPVKALFDMVQDLRFKDIIKSISCNRGFGENYGACVFWNDLDDYDKQNTPLYEGAEFGLHNGEEVIIDLKELLYYLEVVCDKYCKEHPEDNEIINAYIIDFKKNNNLDYNFR